MNDAVLAFDAIRQEFPTPGADAIIRVIDGISFEVGSGKFVAVIGPSGCGKSTLLQMAAGLLMPTRGGVRHRGRAINDVNREVGFVPQQAQLFPWKTLAENVELPLLLRGVANPERKQRVAAALEAVGLSGFEQYFPGQLSGGMQKRGSIARTLVYRPDVILMDEPFGALDAQTRMVMQDDLQMLSRDAGATVLFITHDIASVLRGFWPTSRSTCRGRAMCSSRFAIPALKRPMRRYGRCSGRKSTFGNERIERRRAR